MRLLLIVASLLALCACGRPGQEKGSQPADDPATPPSAASSLSQRVEHQREALEKIWGDEARSLALAGTHESAASKETLSDSASLWSSETEGRLRALLLADGPARRWATFGLGRRCGEKPERIQSALATAVGGWALKTDPPDGALLDAAGWSLGACGSVEAEKTLASWLEPHAAWSEATLSHAAIVGLGVVADRRHELTEQTQAALLDAALGDQKAWALYPLSRLTRLSDAVGERLLDVAGELLGSDDSERRFVILALGSAGPLASGPLGQILLSSDYPAQERSTAAQALSRLGKDGQKVLDETLRDVLRRGLPTKADSELWAPLRAALLAVDLPQVSLGELRTLTSLQLPESKQPEVQAQRRRLVWLRCRAADLIARDRSLSRPLLECDPDHGEVFSLAQVNVLGRSRIEAQRVKVFEDLARSDNPKIAQEALRLIPAHPELTSVSDLLAEALTSQNVGTQATASKIIAAYPARASKKAGDEAPDERIVAALRHILEEATSAPDETLTSALSAAGALGALTLKPAVETHCDGPRTSLHEAAQRALALLGSPKRSCSGPPTTSPKGTDEPNAKPVLSPSRPVTIRFDSDFGPLELILDDPDSPQARAAVVELARAGHFQAHPVHQISAGSGLLFGDPDGDGYDNAQLSVEPVELSPSPFPAMSVGLSSSSEQSAGTQLFVTLAPAPHLRGRRVRLGHATGPWHLLWPGDPLLEPKIEAPKQPAP